MRKTKKEIFAQMKYMKILTSNCNGKFQKTEIAESCSLFGNRLNIKHPISRVLKCRYWIMTVIRMEKFTNTAPGIYMTSSLLPANRFTHPGNGTMQRSDWTMAGFLFF